MAQLHQNVLLFLMLSPCGEQGVFWAAGALGCRQFASGSLGLRRSFLHGLIWRLLLLCVLGRLLPAVQDFGIDFSEKISDLCTVQFADPTI